MKSISVKEFEYINEEIMKTKIEDYNNQFDELLDFIEEFASSPEHEDAYSFMAVKKNRQHGEHVSFKNYVGLIQLKSGFQIEILPKIDTTIDSKKVFLKMLKSLKDFKGKSFNAANLNIDKMNLYEIFINMFLFELSNLVKKGLKSTYISTEDNLNVLKGKLSIKDQIKKNYINKEKFYVLFDEYQLNKPENKIIKSTLLKLQKVSTDSNNKKMARQLLSYFELVEPSVNHDADFDKIFIDRSNKDYEWVIKWSKVFLKNNSFTNFSGNSKSKALLFQMDKLFESYVAKHVRDIFSDTFDVSTQDRGYYLFENPDKFSLRPDLVLRRNGQLIILDTKWKNLVNDFRINYGISQEDMYQMYAYAKKYSNEQENPEVWLLYPLNKEMMNQKDIIYKDSFGVTVHVFFVDVANIEQSINELKKNILSK